jgi:hypothetical protein
MKVIYGNARSGKSSLALKHVDLKKNTLYFCLDMDKRIKQLELYNENLEVIAFPKKQTMLINIESSILEIGGGGIFKNKLKYVVVDSINYVKDIKGRNIEHMLKELAKLEFLYDKFELIVTLNIPKFTKIDPNLLTISDRIEFIESKI